MDEISQAWPKEFFAKRRNIEWRAEIVCSTFNKYFGPKSVVDVGCGNGEFVKWFNDHKIPAVGIEGTENCKPTLCFDPKLLQIRDITKWEKSKEKYDLVMCFMVVGRLDPKYWNVIAWNLASMANEKSIPKGVILTVVEDQRLWTDCMKTAGFFADERGTFEMRQPFIKMNHTAVRSFANHLQVFRRMF